MYDATRCLEFNDHVYGWLANNPTIQTVILSSAFSYLLEPANEMLVRQKDDPSLTKLETAASALSETVAKLKAVGKNVLVVSPPPTNGHNIGNCLRKALLYDGDAYSCDFDRSELSDATISAYSLLRKVSTIVPIIWLDHFMCSSECHTFEGETMFYRDGGHLTHEGSVAIGKRMRLTE
jgi:SGNH domain (fused to AT3 domains)